LHFAIESQILINLFAIFFLKAVAAGPAVWRMQENPAASKTLR
jgi:hypothetical protein